MVDVNFLELVELFAQFIVAGLICRIGIFFIPNSISGGLQTSIQKFRTKTSEPILKLFGQKMNLEVNVLAHIFAPFLALFMLNTTIVGFIYGNTDLTYTNYILWIFYFFILAYLAPTYEDMMHFSQSHPVSIMVFVMKLLAIAQILSTGGANADELAVGILLFPISGLLLRRTEQEEKETIPARPLPPVTVKY